MKSIIELAMPIVIVAFGDKQSYANCELSKKNTNLSSRKANQVIEGSYGLRIKSLL